jgi:hypothetical protein
VPCCIPCVTARSVRRRRNAKKLDERQRLAAGLVFTARSVRRRKQRRLDEQENTAGGRGFCLRKISVHLADTCGYLIFTPLYLVETSVIEHNGKVFIF